MLPAKIILSVRPFCHAEIRKSKLHRCFMLVVLLLAVYLIGAFPLLQCGSCIFQHFLVCKPSFSHSPIYGGTFRPNGGGNTFPNQILPTCQGGFGGKPKMLWSNKCHTQTLVPHAQRAFFWPCQTLSNCYDMLLWWKAEFVQLHLSKYKSDTLHIQQLNKSHPLSPLQLWFCGRKWRSSMLSTAEIKDTTLRRLLPGRPHLVTGTRTQGWQETVAWRQKWWPFHWGFLWRFGRCRVLSPPETATTQPFRQ